MQITKKEITFFETIWSLHITTEISFNQYKAQQILYVNFFVEITSDDFFIHTFDDIHLENCYFSDEHELLCQEEEYKHKSDYFIDMLLDTLLTKLRQTGNLYDETYMRMEKSLKEYLQKQITLDFIRKCHHSIYGL